MLLLIMFITEGLFCFCDSNFFMECNLESVYFARIFILKALISQLFYNREINDVQTKVQIRYNRLPVKVFSSFRLFFWLMNLHFTPFCFSQKDAS